MIRKQERALNNDEKLLVKGFLKRYRSESRKTKVFLVILIFSVFFSLFLLLLSEPSNLMVIVVVVILNILICYHVYAEISELIRYPRNLRKIVKEGKVSITEIKVDRYLEIKSNEGDPEYFLIEYQGKLKLLKPNDINWSNQIRTFNQKIGIWDGNQEYIFHSFMKFSGDVLKPREVLTSKISKGIFETDLWKKLLTHKIVKGSLKGIEENIHKTNGSNG